MQAEEQRKRVIRGIGDCKSLARQSSLEEGEAAEFGPGLRGIDTLLSVDIEQALQLHLEIMARLAVRSFRPVRSLRDRPFDLAPGKHVTPRKEAQAKKRIISFFNTATETMSTPLQLRPPPGGF